MNGPAQPRQGGSRPTGDTVHCGNVRLTADSLVELDNGRPVVTVRRMDVQRMELRYGFPSERPLLSVAFGAVLIAVGLLPLFAALRQVFDAGRVVWKFALIVPLAFAGAYLVVTTLQRGYYLLVVLTRDCRKLRFGQSVTLDELNDFVLQARDRLGCEIDTACCQIRDSH